MRFCEKSSLEKPGRSKQEDKKSPEYEGVHPSRWTVLEHFGLPKGYYECVP
jgi:hypothetical protein